MNNLAVIHAVKEDYDQILKNERIVLVDFWATWCNPCRMLAPVIEQLSNKYNGKAAVVKVDIDENPDLAAQYGIESIPTVIIFENGKEKERVVGLYPITHYEEILKKML